MTATTTVEHPQGHIDDYPEGPVLRDEESEVAELTDDTRRELVALRESGMTLAELKARFPQLTGEQIRDVLPPGNAREARARERKERTGKVTESTQGTGGRSSEAKSEPKPKAEPKPKIERYSTDTDLVVSLSERTLAARQVMGRNALAEALDTTGSAVWRFEQGRIHPTEVEPLYEAIAKVEDRIAAGEFVKEERQPKVAGPSKAELAHRVEAAVTYLHEGAKGQSGKQVAEAVLAILDPPARP